MVPASLSPAAFHWEKPWTVVAANGGCFGHMRCQLRIACRNWPSGVGTQKPPSSAEPSILPHPSHTGPSPTKGCARTSMTLQGTQAEVATLEIKDMLMLEGTQR